MTPGLLAALAASLSTTTRSHLLKGALRIGDSVPRTANDIADACDKTIHILQWTKDGSELAPSDLALTELAVNGLLSKEGYASFEQLHQAVCVTRTYSRTNKLLFGIKYVTQHPNGWIEWRGRCIDRFSYGDPGKQRTNVAHLAMVCSRLEEAGYEVNTETYWKFCTVLGPVKPLSYPAELVESFEQLATRLAVGHAPATATERLAEARLAFSRLTQEMNGLVEVHLIHEMGMNPLMLVAAPLLPKLHDAFFKKLRGVLLAQSDKKVPASVCGITTATTQASYLAGLLVAAHRLTDSKDGQQVATLLTECVDEARKAALLDERREVAPEV